jgi:hypothetical protein
MGPGLLAVHLIALVIQNEIARREQRQFSLMFLTIRRIHEKYSVVIDPNTADGVKVGLEHREAGIPLICIETALPAKLGKQLGQRLCNGFLILGR